MDRDILAGVTRPSEDSTNNKTVLCLALILYRSNSFLLKCSICPPAFQCDFLDKNREFCPLEAEILENEVNVQAIREQRIKKNLIVIQRCERIFAKSGDSKVLGHVEKADSQLEHYLNAYEKISPTKDESLVEKLARKRREKAEAKKKAEMESKKD